MYAWFTESAWPPIMLLATIAGVGIAMFLSSQRAKYLAAALPLLVLGPILYVVEQRIVTERERVERAVAGVANAFEHHDPIATVGYFSNNAVALRRMVQWTIDNVEVTGDLSVTDLSITMRNQDSRAVSFFRANGPIAVNGFGDVGHRATLWELTWQKEGGEWRIIDVQRLDPISGEQMDLLARSERAAH